MEIPKPTPELKAACGLFCAGCRLYIATQENDTALQERIAAGFGLEVEAVQCDGCHGRRNGFYCRTCTMKACTMEKGLEFCHECGEFPCEEIKRFQEARPHRAELWADLARIAEVGYADWFAEAARRYQCPACGEVNSAYDLACRACGHEPGSEYARRHGEAVRQALAAAKARRG